MGLCPRLAFREAEAPELLKPFAPFLFFPEFMRSPASEFAW
jgi:hypothetical protein